MVRSISRVKAAIYEFFEAIWSNLTLTLGFLEPLDKAIRMSEADHAVIGYVVPRWKQLRSYLVTGAQEWQQTDPKFGGIDEIFRKRYNRYVLGDIVGL